MKVYSFKCDSCGSKQYTKTKNGYKCKYCGSLQDVTSGEEANSKQSNEESKVTEELHELKKEYIKTMTYTEKGMRDLGIMLIITVFGGVIGLHKFIERKFFLGFIYLFTWGLLGIGFFFDIFSYVIQMIKLAKKHNSKVNDLIEREEQIINE